MKKRKLVGFGILLLIILGLYSISYADIPLEDLKKEYANEYSQFIEIDGMQVHFRDEGKGETVLLIHGTASSLHTWNAWTQKLKENYRVIRLDLPAFGLTGPNANGDYSINAYTQFINKFVSKLQLDSFHIAGNSLGGNIAWNYTSEHPEKVEKLILVDASGLATGKPQPSVFKMAKTPIVNKLFLFITPQFFIRKNIKEVYEDDTKISDELIERYHKLALRTGNRQAFIDRAKGDFIKEGETVKQQKLKDLKTPTLLIWGAQDNWIPLSNGKKMDSLLPNSQLKIIENSGHVPMEENPEESLALLLEFLRK